MSDLIDSNQVFLRITSFIGIVPGACHFFGELQCNGHYFDLYHELTERQAILVNEYSPVKYKPGENYPGFDSKDDVIAAAKESWRERFPDALSLWLKKPGLDDLLIESVESPGVK